MTSGNPVPRRLRVAFVVQRCGLEVNGGAESHCLQVAQHMSRHWDTEVLTTCALDYMRWDNFYPEGSAKIGETMVRRFAVDEPRNVERFNALSEELSGQQANTSLPQQEAWMRAQGPMSRRLLNYLQAERDHYDAFIFFGYLYATTYFGLPLVHEKAFLAPLAHDEWPIYFGMWERIFSLPVALIFNTAVERDFLRRRFPRVALDGPVVGVGIQPPVGIDAEKFRKRYRLEEPFLLYVGRIDASKGCGEMFDYFMNARNRGAISHRLVLAGTEVMPVPFHDHLISLGFVDEKEKWEALAGCDWLIMPSQHESLSMVLLEAWSLQKPALVNGKSEVLRAHCESSHGGLWYENEAEWAAAISCIDRATKRQLGRNGMRYVKENFSWDRVITAYQELFAARKVNARTGSNLPA